MGRRFIQRVIVLLCSLIFPTLAVYLAKKSFRLAVLVGVVLVSIKTILILFMSLVLDWQSYVVIYAITVLVLHICLGIWVLATMKGAEILKYRYKMAFAAGLFSLGLQASFLYIKNLSPFPRYRQYVVPSESMLPTLKVGDRILADHFYDLSQLQVGDVVVFNSEEGNSVFVKRVMATQGDEILVKKDLIYSSSGNETLIQQGEAIEGMRYVQVQYGPLKYKIALSYEDPLFVRHLRQNWPQHGTFKVPESSYFMLGDNRSHSRDSRWLGPVQQKDIIGKVLGISYYISPKLWFDKSRFLQPL